MILYECSQSKVFDSVVAPMLPHFLSGFNCTVFTYGQTGSGKTYTMFGAHAAQNPTKAKPGPKQKITVRNRFAEAQTLVINKNSEAKQAPE